MRTDFIAHSYSYVIGVSDKITHMTMKIAVTPEYADEKDTFTHDETSYFWFCCKHY